jgi:hypothetical protein
MQGSKIRSNIERSKLYDRDIIIEQLDEESNLEQSV